LQVSYKINAYYKSEDREEYRINAFREGNPRAENFLGRLFWKVALDAASLKLDTVGEAGN